MAWEERWHPLRREWVIVAAHRNQRPWSGETVTANEQRPPAYDADCYLCPGNTRVSGETNPNYTGIYVFDNDMPCVGPAAPKTLPADTPMFRRKPAEGIARVVCYTPRHDLTLAELPVEQVDDLLAAWQDQYRELGQRPEVNHVLMFENKGEVVGVSNPHPHGQIYATNVVFPTIATEVIASREHFASTKRSLLGDILGEELADGSRIVCQNDSAVAWVPFFARYAYEVYVAPKAAHASIAELSPSERKGFAAVLSELLIRFDNLWRMSFPYVLCLHNAPTDGGDYAGFHFHVEFHPPLRQPHLRKHLAGPEVGGGGFLSDTAPEDKAAELRATPATHYRVSEGLA